MSKATRPGYEAHPDWFVHNAKGEALEYNGTYRACVNGGWYRDYSLQIISESLGKYDVDGVFFNMFGYTNFTYSGHYFGTCVCDNCRRRFQDMYGKPLPAKEDFSDPSYADYLEFKDRTSLELRAKVYKHIKQVAPKVAMTGHRGDSDLIRMETQRAVDRPQPEWPYQAGEQARWGRAYGQGKTVSSTSANFIDFCPALRVGNRGVPTRARRPATGQRRHARLLPARRDGPGRQVGFRRYFKAVPLAQGQRGQLYRAQAGIQDRALPFARRGPRPWCRRIRQASGQRPICRGLFPRRLPRAGRGAAAV
ncbi:hypothetical protein N8D56_27415 (plasmid) [Devosia sp. A8/3-2]|nr:hypothetical protein N8D56_27415 [Devosia sp. A8/3-2]